MATTLYLHPDLTTVGGTLPTTEQSVISTPDIYHIGLDEHLPGEDNSATHRTMTPSVGSSETNINHPCPYDSQNYSMLAQFVSPELATQTIDSGEWLLIVDAVGGFDFGYSGLVWFTLYLWRPSTGALVTMIADEFNAGTINEVGRTELAADQTGASANATAGDVLILELWLFDQSVGVGDSTTDLWYGDGNVGRLVAPVDLSFSGGSEPGESTFIPTWPRVSRGTSW